MSVVAITSHQKEDIMPNNINGTIIAYITIKIQKPKVKLEIFRPNGSTN